MSTERYKIDMIKRLLMKRKLPPYDERVAKGESTEDLIVLVDVIVPRFIKKVLMRKHKTNGLHDYLVFVVKLDGLDLC